jgi:NAD(P)-dependent dehydrogenase (short-subunit alcohol dehydrogenase family)
MQLTDRVVLVTGGKRIGAVVAEHLAARGADIAVSYRASREEAEATVAAVTAAGRRGVAIAADLARPADCEALVTRTVASLGGLDVLIHMASIYSARPFDELTGDELRANLAVEVEAAYHCARAAAPHMRARGGGRIVCLSDWVAASGRPRYKGYLPYYVAKRGIIGLVEALALELAGDQILVNAVAPGPIMAPPELTPDEYSAIEEATPVGFWGGAGAIARAVAYLIDSDFVTGETIRVDGGRHVR